MKAGTQLIFCASPAFPRDRS